MARAGSAHPRASGHPGLPLGSPLSRGRADKDRFDHIQTSSRHSPDWEALSVPLVFGTLSAVAIVVLVAPTLIMLLTSLTASQSLRFPPDGLSLRWYAALLEADQMQRAAWNSLIVACWTTAISVGLGTLAALAVAGRTSF